MKYAPRVYSEHSFVLRRTPRTCAARVTSDEDETRESPRGARGRAHALQYD
jgi:hypothetical protein